MKTIQHQPQLKVGHAFGEIKLNGAFPNSTRDALWHIVSSIMSALLIPAIALLDLLFFTFTRPNCSGCANLSVYFADYSMTMAFIQSNKAIQSALVVLKKVVWQS